MPKYNKKVLRQPIVRIKAEKSCTVARRLNSCNWKCPAGQSICAIQSEMYVTIVCKCDFTASKVAVGVINHIDVFNHFCDMHREHDHHQRTNI